MNQGKYGNSNSVFFDTYTLYEIAKGGESYRPYASGHRILTTLMNLYELYFTLMRNGRQKLAEEFIARLESACIPITVTHIKHAANFRLQHLKKGFSYVDSLSYTVALSPDIPFLTGDNAFRGFSSVQFVK
ncbi:PIN domain-containing protein [Candidatus Woesearchaeota archaeon]|nr:PIN domain-containing protein [Candidatus Woesearchaeota archaeon]